MGLRIDGRLINFWPRVGKGGSLAGVVTAICAVLITGAANKCAFAQSTDPQGNTSSPTAATFSSIVPDAPGGSHAAKDLRVFGPNPSGWLFPVTEADKRLPRWLQFGGQFRDRVESQDGLAYAPVDDTYDLTQLRIGIYVQPTKWLKLVGVTQDSRVFFNHHVAMASPYQNTWDIREAYLQLGNATEAWYDLVVGRQMFSFGDERVIGPSDWSNMGRTFDTARLDLHTFELEDEHFRSFGDQRDRRPSGPSHRRQ